MNNRHENRKNNQFFIDRVGKVHKFEGDCKDIISIHFEIANRIYPGLRNPDDKLMEEGWVLCGSSVYSCPIIHSEPSQAQLDKLFDLGLLKNLCILEDNFYPKYIK